MFFHLDNFFLSWHTCYAVRDGASGNHQGRATHVTALWHCMWGRSQRGNNDACSGLSQLSVTSSTTHKQIGRFWCWLLGGWVCVHSRTLLVSPMNFPMRLGVSPTAWTPTGVFNQRFEGLFPLLEPWVARSAWFPSCSSWFICTWMWDHLLHQPQPPLLWSTSRCLAAGPLQPAAHLRPSHQSGWCFLFNSLVVGLPYSLTFCQFWLFFVFKFVVVLLLVVWGGTVCLPMPSSWPEVPKLLLDSTPLYWSFIVWNVLLFQRNATFLLFKSQLQSYLLWETILMTLNKVLFFFPLVTLEFHFVLVTAQNGTSNDVLYEFVSILIVCLLPVNIWDFVFLVHGGTPSTWY